MTDEKIIHFEEADPTDGELWFSAKNPDTGEEEKLIEIKKGSFFWKGEEVEDKYQVYERFNEWLRAASYTTPKEKTALCVMCKLNWVDIEDGYDTCEGCREHLN